MDNPSTCDACKMVDQRDAPCDEDTASERDLHGNLTRAMRGAEEACLHAKLVIPMVESDSELRAAANALLAAVEARRSIRMLIRHIMKERGHSV